MRRQSRVERFWTNVKKTDGCWVWTGKPTPDGYGRFNLHGGMLRAHRFSYALANGPIPEGLYVLHSCDNRLCVRPDHLFLGTHGDNMEDMVSKGRAARGSRNQQSKLTDDQVLEIRRRYQAGGINQRELADEYGVANQLISFIVRGKRWTHLNGSSA